VKADARLAARGNYGVQDHARVRVSPYSGRQSRTKTDALYCIDASEQGDKSGEERGSGTNESESEAGSVSGLGGCSGGDTNSSNGDSRLK